MMQEVDNLDHQIAMNDPLECGVFSDEDDDDDCCRGGEEHYAIVPIDDDDVDEEMAVIPSASTDDTQDDDHCGVVNKAGPVKASAKKKKGRRRRWLLRRFRRRRRRGSQVRIGAASWWTELKNVETSGCSFVLGYICLSFVLMTLMFNMREIVGDYCLGSKEQKQEEYRENLEKAMEVRRRSPFPTDEENRFEMEAAELYYDGQGQAGADLDYWRNHRVPILLREEYDEDEFEELEEP